MIRPLGVRLQPRWFWILVAAMVLGATLGAPPYLTGQRSAFADAASTTFTQTSVQLPNVGSQATITVQTTNVDAGADAVQINIQHTAAVTVTAAACEGIFAGATVLAASATPGGTLIGCFFLGGPNVSAVTGNAMTFTLTRAGAGTPLVTLLVNGFFGTQFSDGGTAIGPGATNTLQVLLGPPPSFVTLVTASPNTAGDLAEYTFVFTVNALLPANLGEFRITWDKDTQIPASIGRANVLVQASAVQGGTGATPNQAVALSFDPTFDTDGFDSRRKVVIIKVPDMDPNTGVGTTGVQDISANAVVTVTFTTGAGIKNSTDATTGGQFDLRACTGACTGTSPNVISSGTQPIVDTLLDLLIDDIDGPRGQKLTIIGKGFKNGTTATVWLDVNNNGLRDAGEQDIATALVGSDLRFTAVVTISNPPFLPAPAVNFINAKDSNSPKASVASLDGKQKTFLLLGSVTATPTTVARGDTISIDLKDFPPSSAVAGVTLAGVPVIVPAGTTTSASGEVTFSAIVPQGVPTGIQRLNVNFAGSGNQRFLLVVQAAVVTAPSITTTSLPVGTAGVLYNQTLTATGGTTPYTWSIFSGSLSAGLSLNAAGVISGTPTAAGTSSFTAQVTDSSSPQQTATKQLSITVVSAQAIPSSYFGTVTIQGANLTTGTTITATVAGDTYTSDPTGLGRITLGVSDYTINVTQPSGKNYAGQTITFRSGTATATTPWLIGDHRADLVLVPTASTVPVPVATALPASFNTTAVLNSVYGVDAAGNLLVYNPARPAALNTLTTLTPGAGYIVITNVNTTATIGRFTYTFIAGVVQLIGFLP